MRWTICVPVPKDRVTIDGSRYICFPVYVDERPLRLQPDPTLFTHPDFSKEDVHALQYLAAIDYLADQLPRETAHDIRHSVDSHMQALGKKLGPGISLSRQKSEK